MTGGGGGGGGGGGAPGPDPSSTTTARCASAPSDAELSADVNRRRLAARRSRIDPRDCICKFNGAPPRATVARVLGDPGAEAGDTPGER